ncbi:MAG: NBR1-Ig-like domain-containing protein [Chloroflexota bacterium]
MNTIFSRLALHARHVSAQHFKHTALHLVVLLALILSGCNLPSSKTEATATLGVTQAYQTVEARLTQAAAESPAPSDTPAPTSAELATATPTVQATAASPTKPPATTAAPVVSCDLAAAGSPSIDVTIPDDTVMSPGEDFTKIWRLQNVGTCAWTEDYSIAFFSGDDLGADLEVPMPTAVPPGTSIDVAVDMVAPLEADTYQSNWKLKNESGDWFGIGPGGGSYFWVRIVVEQSAEATSSVTATTGPAVLVTGSKTLAPNDAIDLDTNQVNSGVGEDVLYEFGLDSNPQFTPLNGAAFGLYGGNQPSYEKCKATALGSGTIALKGLKDLYLCYQTSSGLYGFMLMKGYNAQNSALTLQFSTWAAP